LNKKFLKTAKTNPHELLRNEQKKSNFGNIEVRYRWEKISNYAEFMELKGKRKIETKVEENKNGPAIGSFDCK
jgi:hypothetical protein